MTILGAVRSPLPGPLHVVSLRQLEWITIILPLAFVLAHHYLMVGPMHPFFHNWYGFSILLVPMAVAVWLFSKAVFGTFGRMQEEIEQLHQEAQVQVVERERQHIAREMHDGLAQVLSFVNTKAQAAEEFLHALDELKNAAAILSEIQDEVRRAGSDISSIPLPHMGYVEAAARQMIGKD